MNPRKRFTPILILVLPALLLPFTLSATIASSGDGFQMSSSVVAGGGGGSWSPVFSLEGTIGQSDVGGMRGGNFALEGGYWEQILEYLYILFFPIIMR